MMFAEVGMPGVVMKFMDRSGRAGFEGSESFSCLSFEMGFFLPRVLH